MSKVKTTYMGNLCTQTEHLDSGVTITTDALQEKGNEKSFSPIDLFATSYVACALSMAGFAAQRHAINIDGAVAFTESVKGDNPRRVAELKVTFIFPHNNYSAKEQRIIEASMNGCPVGNSLDSDLKITKIIRYQE